jgi:hypothetical protein
MQVYSLLKSKRLSASFFLGFQQAFFLAAVQANYLVMAFGFL